MNEGLVVVEVVRELLAAVRRVNVAYLRIPELQRPDPAAHAELDAEVDAAISSRDRARAIAAIRAWEKHWLSVLGDARAGE